MAASLGLEDAENSDFSSVIAVWKEARTHMGTHTVGALWRDVAEVVKAWPSLKPELRAAILTFVRN
jgi:hypothetical protein